MRGSTGTERNLGRIPALWVPTAAAAASKRDWSRCFSKVTEVCFARTSRPFEFASCCFVSTSCCFKTFVAAAYARSFSAISARRVLRDVFSVETAIVKEKCQSCISRCMDKQSEVLVPSGTSMGNQGGGMW